MLTWFPSLHDIDCILNILWYIMAVVGFQLHYIDLVSIVTHY